MSGQYIRVGPRDVGRRDPLDCDERRPLSADPDDVGFIRCYGCGDTIVLSTAYYYHGQPFCADCEAYSDGDLANSVSRKDRR